MVGIPPIIPWEPCNIPTEIQDELNRRRINRSLVYVDVEKGGWDNKNGKTGDWSANRGPMSPWVRFCSNGVGREFETDNNLNTRYDNTGNPIPVKQRKEGFVLYGGKSFYTSYGFPPRLDAPGVVGESFIGFTPEGVPHVIYNDLKTSEYPIHVPPPEIEKVTVTIQKELYRKATIDWVCFSKAQLEYMTPYFLIPGISCILEWGWNIFNPNSLLPLRDIAKLKQYNNNPYPLYTEHILQSKGNYDVLFGRITNFEWIIENNKIKCKTEITSQDRIYAGVVADATAVTLIEDAKNREISVQPENNLLQFMEKYLPLFKTIGSTGRFDVATEPKTKSVINYIKKHHPDNWKEYIFGVFYGRDKQEISNTQKDTNFNLHEDFDHNGDMKDLWINLGLAVEIINYHVSKMKGFKNDEMFRIDIDDVVVSGHPNLISCDGSVLLIPNAEAPKYFAGLYAIQDDKNIKRKDYDVMFNATNFPIKIKNRDDAKKKNLLADYRLNTVCRQAKWGSLRDDLNLLINRIRIERSGATRSNSDAYPFEFPFIFDRDTVKGSKPYPRRYSGFLKNLYVNAAFLHNIAKDESVKTYLQFIDKMLTGISTAAGGFWDFRVVGGTGKAGQDPNEPATLKIVDYRFVATVNRGNPFSFTYTDADSLLLGLTFKPTLSNAQAIRTIYARTNNPDSTYTLTNGESELLEYHFRDRLYKDDLQKAPPEEKNSTTEFTETMRQLQELAASANMYQMTSRVEGQIVIRRLAMPAPDVLKLLLDDGDEENNPKYTGIMPGIQASFSTRGIGGLRTFMMFLVKNLPEPYSENNIIFRIVDIQEVIEAGKWITNITCGIIPLRGYIKERLGITSGTFGPVPPPSQNI